MTQLPPGGMRAVRVTSQWVPARDGADRVASSGSSRNVAAAAQLYGVTVYVSVYPPRLARRHR